MSNIYMEYLTESEREELILEKEIDLINNDIDYLFTTYEATDDGNKQGIIKRLIEKINVLLDKIRNDFVPKIKKIIKEIKTTILSRQGKHYAYKKNIFIMDKYINAFTIFLTEYEKVNLLTSPSALEDLTKYSKKLVDSIKNVNYIGNKKEKVLISNKDINEYEDMAEKILTISLMLKQDINNAEKEMTKLNEMKISAVTSNDFIDIVKVLNTTSKIIEDVALSMFKYISTIKNDIDAKTI